MSNDTTRLADKLRAMEAGDSWLEENDPEGRWGALSDVGCFLKPGSEIQARFHVPSVAYWETKSAKVHAEQIQIEVRGHEEKENSDAGVGVVTLKRG